MRAFQNSESQPGPRAYPCSCGYHPSDAWILVDTLVTIVACVATIVVIVLRHPFYVLATLILLSLVWPLTGW